MKHIVIYFAFVFICLTSYAQNRTVVLSKDSLSCLKAVLIAGPLEGDTEHIQKIRLFASYLQSLGIKVTTFYPPNNSWDDIICASEGANIFMYSGHGTTLGEKGKSGGLCLSDKFVSSDDIIKKLRLHKNALVLFYRACLSAGSSATDNKDIGFQIASQRVSDYAYPFINIGIGGYYADNDFEHINKFIYEFLNKKNINQIYQDFF